MAVNAIQEVNSENQFGFHNPENYIFKSVRGLTREVLEQISEMKDEPATFVRTDSGKG